LSTVSLDDLNDITRTYVPLSNDTIIGHYRIIKKIGAGGMGEVYLAEDTELHRKVALKFLPSHLCQDADCRARFKREAQAAAKLGHPNVVAVHEVGEFNGRPFFVMQHIEGRSLRDVIQDEELSLGRIISLTIEILEGLREAHEAGIIHRDIKPSNIIIDRKGQPKLLDFGLAAIKGTDKLTKTGSTLGTMGYMSPEQAEGKQTDQRSDLFSLGVVLYEMIAGRRPFDRESDVATGKAIVTETPEPLARYKSGISEGLQRIVDQALEKNLETRYQTASGMLVDLRRIASSQGLTVAQRKKVSTLTWVAVILAVIIVVMWGGTMVKNWMIPAKAAAKSLAVVDFANVGAEEDAYLAHGLAEDLAIKLRKLAGFRVASTEDSRRLSKQSLSPKEVASRLDVQYALAGSMLKAGDRVRVNVELIDRATGNVIWSDQLDRKYSEVHEFHDEVSRNIASTLQVNLTQAERKELKKRPTNNVAAYDHYLRGRQFYYSVTFRDNELAVKEFQKALDSDPKYTLAMAGLADAYVQRYKERYDYDEYWLDQADTLIDKALKLESNLAEAHESRAELLFENENYLGALESAEKAKQLEPNWDEPYVHLGKIYQEQGERKQALEMFENALAIRPSVDAWCGKGKILQTRGDLKSAEAAYRAALELNPEHDRPYNELGSLYDELKQPAEAEKSYRKAIEVRPDRRDGYANLTWFLSGTGRDKEIEELLQEFVEKYPYHWDAYNALYEFYAWNKGDYLKAAHVMEQAVSRNPERAWPHLLLAWTYAYKMSTQPEPEKTVKAIEQALSLRPHSASVLKEAGAIYAEMGDSAKSLEYFNRALVANPGSQDILISMVLAFESMHNFEQAAQYAMQAVNQTPGNPFLYYYVLRRTLVPLGRSEEFFKIVVKAAQKYGEEEPDFLWMLAREQLLAGQFQAAILTCRRALAIKKDDRYSAQLGYSQWAFGDTPGALVSLREAHGNYGATKMIVLILKSQGRFAEIERYLEELRKPKPGEYSGPDAWGWIAGNYYASMRRFEEAIAAAKLVRQTGEESWAEYSTIAMANWYLQKGTPDSASQLLKETIASSPASVRVWALFALARFSAVERNFTVALELIERARKEEKFPNDVVTELLGLIQYASGSKEDAEKTLMQITGHVFGGGLTALYRKVQFEILAGSPQAHRDLDLALMVTTRWARGEFPWDDVPLSIATRALVLAHMGRLEEAKREVETYLQMEPERADIAYYAAAAYSLMDDSSNGLHWLKIAAERNHLDLWWARVDPDLDNLRKSPRFQSIIKEWDIRLQALFNNSAPVSKKIEPN